MKIKCPLCKNESVQSEIDCSVDENGSMFFTCPHCTKESVDIEWISEFKNMNKKKSNVGSMFLNICKTDDGKIHFCDQNGGSTMCGRDDFCIIDMIEARKCDLCEDCLNKVSSMFGIPTEAIKTILGLDSENE